LGQWPGGERGRKALTVIHSVLAGGDSIDDCDALRAGSTAAVLGHAVAAPSTVGTFLRAFSWGHARQIDRVAAAVLARAWAAGIGPGDRPMTIDVDSSIIETYGCKNKAEAASPIRTSAATTPIRHRRRDRRCRALTSARRAREQRPGSCRVPHRNVQTGPGGRSDRTTVRPRRFGFLQPVGRSACTNAGVTFSITAKMTKKLRALIEGIDAAEWAPIPYFLDDGADVAEVAYQAFPHAKGGPGIDCRLIVRRVRPTPGSQLALFTTWSYHAFITDRAGTTTFLEADHRRHAVVENAIRDLKYGVGLNHLPSGRFGANAAWLGLNVIAHNMSRWSARLGGSTPAHQPTPTSTSRPVRSSRPANPSWPPTPSGAATSAHPAGSPAPGGAPPCTYRRLAVGRTLPPNAHQPPLGQPHHLNPQHQAPTAQHRRRADHHQPPHLPLAAWQTTPPTDPNDPHWRHNEPHRHQRPNDSKRLSNRWIRAKAR